jgi:hypothetical protein
MQTARKLSRPSVLSLLGLTVITLWPGIHAYTWPDIHIDDLEQYLYEHKSDGTGRAPFGDSPAPGVFPCTTVIVDTDDTGRLDSAEWIRTAYHDMATADTTTGLGGVDASIGFETHRPENIGNAFNGTLNFFLAFQSERVSMADLLAMGASMAAEACSDGKVKVPFRGGRVDAKAAGPAGVPEPHQDLANHKESFKKQGFNTTEMIGLVACGHTLGGVHGKDFPEIVPKLNDPVCTFSCCTEGGTNRDFVRIILKAHMALMLQSQNSITKCAHSSSACSSVSSTKKSPHDAMSY